MAQGNPRDKEACMEILKPYFQLGCAVKRACAYAGIPPSTVETWIQNDDDLRAKVTGWQNEIAAKARANWRAKIAQQDYGASKDWLERMEKGEFSLRNEHTGPDGAPLPTPIFGNYVQHDDGHEEGGGDAKKD
jgi:hypothetical protein